MKVCIHRGSKEIGGTCVELEAQGQRMVLDVGVPLDVKEPDQFPLHPIKGFEQPDPSLLGVVISHPHQDHYGLAYRLPEQTSFAIGQGAASVLEAAGVFTPAGLTLTNVTHLVDRTPFTWGPFTITPYRVDHSAFDSYAVLVEADGTGLFYSGDLRAHGRMGALFQELLRCPPAPVDVLLMEGTTLGRMQPEGGFPTEAELEARFVSLFNETKGMPLVWCSGQNIDRIVSIIRACIKTQRTLILDMYTAHILRATGNEAILGACGKYARVFLPAGQKRQIIWKERFDVSNLYKPYRIYGDQIAETAARSVMLFRPSMAEELTTLGCLQGARLIYSLWSGYLQDEKQKPFLAWLEKHQIPLDMCHTSGHASVADLVKLRSVFPNAPLVPIHTDQPEQFETVFGNVKRCGDGEWWEVGTIRSLQHA
jgi:ribonuclease J